MDLSTALFGLVRGVMGLSAIVVYFIPWTTALIYRVFGSVPCLAGVIVGIGVAYAMREPAALSGACALRELIATRHSRSWLVFTVNAVCTALLLGLIVLRWAIRLIPRSVYFAIWLYDWGASGVTLGIDLGFLTLDVYRDIVFLCSLAVTFCRWVVVFYSKLAQLYCFITWTYVVFANALRAVADFLLTVPAHVRHSFLVAATFFGNLKVAIRDLMYTHSGDVEDWQAAFDWWVADVNDALPACLVDAFEGLRHFYSVWLAWAPRFVTCIFRRVFGAAVFVVEVPFLRFIWLCAIAVQCNAYSWHIAATAFSWFIMCLGWATSFMEVYVRFLGLAIKAAEFVLEDVKTLVGIYNYCVVGILSLVAGSLELIVELVVSGIPSWVCTTSAGFVLPQHRTRGKLRATYALLVWFMRQLRKVVGFCTSQSPSLSATMSLPTWLSLGDFLALLRSVRPVAGAFFVVYLEMAWSTLVHSIAIFGGLLSLIGMVMTTFRAIPSPLRLSFEMDKPIKVEIESISITMEGLGSYSNPSHFSSARSSPEPPMVSGGERVAVVSRSCRPASEPVVDRGRSMATAPLRATSSDSSTPRLRPRRVLKQALPRAALR